MKTLTDEILVGPPARRQLEDRVLDALDRGTALAFVQVQGLAPNEVVHRLVGLAPVTRLGAVDEFAVALDGIEPDDILRALDEPGVTATMGVALAVANMTTGELLRAADLALRAARRQCVEVAVAADAAEAARPRVRTRRFRRVALLPSLARIPA